MRPCCQDASKRQVVAQDADKVVQQCIVCGARHIEFTVDPIPVGITLHG